MFHLLSSDSHQFTQLLSCVRHWNSTDCSTLGFPVLHYFLELTQTHVHQVIDAIQPSHPLSSPSPPAFNLSQHRGLFQWVSSSHQVAKELGVSFSASALPMNIQDWFPLGLSGLISLQSKGLSKSGQYNRISIFHYKLVFSLLPHLRSAQGWLEALSKRGSGWLFFFFSNVHHTLPSLFWDEIPYFRSISR